MNLQDRLAQVEQQRDAWKEVAEAYNDVNLPEHQRRRMEELAQDWERICAERNRLRAKLQRILEMADAWESTWGDGGIKASVAAEALRRTIQQD